MSPRSAPLLTWGSKTHAQLRSPAMLFVSRCWRSAQNAVGLVDNARLDEALEAWPATARAEIAATGSEKRLRPAEMRPGQSNPGSISGDAMAEAFRRAGSA